jgi:hypothetical protein
MDFFAWFLSSPDLLNFEEYWMYLKLNKKGSINEQYLVE